MKEFADLVIRNARVFTSNPQQPYAETVAIKGNKILFVGHDKDSAELCGKDTVIISGQGRTLTAGFIDTHVHLLSGATWMGHAELSQVHTQTELKFALLKHSKKYPAHPWVIGWRANYEVVSTRHHLDEILANKPVYIRSADAHTAWANTLALEMAGILHYGTDAGILRDANGTATGELREPSAMQAVLNCIPPPEKDFIYNQLSLAAQGFNQTGITSVHNMNGNMQDLQSYLAAQAAGLLNLRVYVPFEVKPEATESDLYEAVEMSTLQGQFVRGGAVKFFMDGVWEAYTAFNLEPYADDPAQQASPLFSLEHFAHMATACDKHGLQIAVHCCGDAAVRQTLNGFEAIQKINGKRDSRHRIEHVEVCQPADMPRFKELGVIASIQASHAPLNLEEGGVARHRLGPARWKFWQPWRDLKEAGAMLSLGSDWTVVPYDPMTHLFAALNREPYSLECTSQRLTLEECIAGYTRDAAFVEFKEHEKGQVQVGYLADLVLFSHDLFSLAPQDIAQAKAILTLVNGKVVYQDPAY